MELGSEADLGVDHAVGGEVDRRLVGDPLDGLRLLHHGRRVLERRQVLQEVGRLGAAVNQPAARRDPVDGNVQPISSASSMTVCGRSPPSR